MEAKLDRVIEAQLRQERRLALLESRTASGPLVASGVPTGLPHDIAKLPIPPLQERIREKEKMIASMQHRFLSQPVNATWAIVNERRISDFLDRTSLRSAGLPDAHVLGVECRSSSCRVEAAFADDASADVTLQAFYTAMASTLPSAQTFRTTGSDGSVQAIVFAEPGTRTSHHSQ